MARQTIQTPEKAQKILDALALHPSKTRACRAARISRAAFYAWCNEDAAFAAKVEEVREQGVDAIEDALFQLAGSGKDTTAAIFMLKSWRRERYGDKSQHDHRHQHRHQHYDFSDFTPEQQAQIDELAAQVQSGRLTS